MILVAGATGYLGAEICQRLRAHGKSVRALVRQTSDPAKINRLRSIGVELAYGDLRDNDSLERACQEVEVVISGVSSIAAQNAAYIAEVDQQGQRNLVEAAAKAWVKHFVYVSLSKNMTTDSPLHDAKHQIEKRLQASTMLYTVLCPCFFMEYWLSPILAFDPIAGEVRIYGTGEQKISWITIGDVAEFAARAVDQPAARNAFLQIGGPAALSPLEVIHIFEGLVGHAVKVESVPEAALQAQWSSTSDAHTKSIMGLLLDYVHGDVIDMDATANTFGIALESVKEYAQRVISR